MSSRAVAIFALGFSPLIVTVAQAQWSNDPSNNLIVATNNGSDQTDSHIVATPDGGFYVSWIDWDDGGSVRLQRLDAGGHELWPHNGIRVGARNMQFTASTGLAVDSAGNALLSYACCSNATFSQMIVNKILPDGTPAWGASGVNVSTGTDTDYYSFVAEASDGAVVVAWGSDVGMQAQRIDSSGLPTWSTPLQLGGSGLGGIIASIDGSFIVSMIANSELATQRIATDGSLLWGSTPLVVGGSDGSTGSRVGLSSDGNGGAVFAWDMYLSGAMVSNVRVQSIDGSGTRLFAADGVDVSTDSSVAHFNPMAVYDASIGTIYIVWSETDANQTVYGVNAQAVDVNGQRLWGDLGVALVPMDAGQTLSGPTLLSSGGIFASWMTSPGSLGFSPTTLRTALLDGSGALVWANPVVDFKTSTTGSSKLAGAVNAQGMAAFSWTDNDASIIGSVLAQNVNPDGSLGALSDIIFADGFEN